jgi:hypothetical protein
VQLGYRTVALKPRGTLGPLRFARAIFDVALIRNTSDGILDSSFNGTGIVTTDFIGGNDIVRDLAIQSDGEIGAAAGSKTESASGSDLENRVDVTLARYSDAGVLAVAATIAHADSVLAGFAGKLPYKVTTSSSAGVLMAPDAATLNQHS